MGGMIIPILMKTLEKILNRKKQLWFDRRLKRLDTDPEICQRSLKKLENVLSELDTSNLIVAMHFCSSQSLHHDASTFCTI